MNPDDGGLTVLIEDRTIDISRTGGGSWRLEVGSRSLVEDELAGADPPGPVELTNALAAVRDRLDDVVVLDPSVLDAPSVVFAGHHPLALARVEIGSGAVPGDYRLRRPDAEEVFRTLVAESAEERLHNPGLDAGDVDTVIGTCCVVLAVVRRLELHDAGILVEAPQMDSGA